ncbi:MAG: threonylcarbamoyl-AMP synthase [Clostridiales bacterium]|nr:threonylcarbamoyl-AMP synthase [Clostridiales bacterium]
MGMDKITEIIKINRENIDRDAIGHCADVLRQGGLVCFPTETVYGLGANAYSAEAVNNIYKAKERPADNPLIVHISDCKMLDLVTDCGGTQREILNRLAQTFWPGPLTVIASRDDAIPSNVSCGLDTVGIRFPSHPIARALIEAAGVPIAAPSANLSGRPSPTRATHVIEDMMGRVDIIIDGGSCDVGVESTVFDIAGEKMSILRPGAVTLTQISAVVKYADELDWMHPGNEAATEKPRSPGLKYRHYAPKASVTIFDGPREAVARQINAEIKIRKKEGFSVGVLATDESICYYKEVGIVVQSLGSLGDSLQQASNLFHCLRKFDDMGIDVVFAEALPRGGAGDAVMNRLYRAAGGAIRMCGTDLPGTPRTASE